MARAKRHYIPGYAWHTPVKQSKKRFNGVNNTPMPSARISFKIPKRPAPLDRVALPGKEKIQRFECMELYGHLKPCPPACI
jgi:hypothetical protein